MHSETAGVWAITISLALVTAAPAPQPSTIISRLDSVAVSSCNTIQTLVSNLGFGHCGSSSGSSSHKSFELNIIDQTNVENDSHDKINNTIYSDTVDLGDGKNREKRQYSELHKRRIEDTLTRVCNDKTNSEKPQCRGFKDTLVHRQIDGVRVGFDTSFDISHDTNIRNDDHSVSTTTTNVISNQASNSDKDQEMEAKEEDDEAEASKELADAIRESKDGEDDEDMKSL